MAVAEPIQLAAVAVCVSPNQIWTFCINSCSSGTKRQAFLRKPNKNCAYVAACSVSRYSASPPACCRRTHFFGIISGSRRTSFFLQLHLFFGSADWRDESPLFSLLRSWELSGTSQFTELM